MPRVQGGKEEHQLSGKESNCLVQQKLLSVCPLCRVGGAAELVIHSRRIFLPMFVLFFQFLFLFLFPAVLPPLCHNPSVPSVSGLPSLVPYLLNEEVDGDTLGMNRWEGLSRVEIVVGGTLTAAIKTVRLARLAEKETPGA